MRNSKARFLLAFLIGLASLFMCVPALRVQAGVVLSAYNLIQDEGSPLPKRSTVNFVGSGITCTDAAPVTECDVTGGGASAYDQIQDEGMNLTQFSTINFTGAGITCVDGMSKTDCDVPGGGGGGGATRGLFAAAPTCDMSAMDTTYFATDAGLLGQCDGSTWGWFFGSFEAFPTSTSVSSIWYNQTSATIAATPDAAAVLLTGTAQGGANIQARLQTVPSAPYTYVACGNAFIKNASVGSVGVVITDGATAANKAITVAIFQQSAALPVLAWAKYTNATSFSGTSYTTNNFPISQNGPLCFGITDDGVNRRAGWNLNGRWYTGGAAAVSNTDFLTATHVGYFVNSEGAGIPSFFIWSEHVYASALF